MAVALVALMSMPVIGQLGLPNDAQCNPQLLYAQYQTWFQNASMQHQRQTAGLPPVMQLQMTINVIKGELAL